MVKKTKNRLLIIVIMFIILLVACAYLVLKNYNFNNNEKIIATKTITQDNGEKTVITYTIKKKEYATNIQKVILFPTKEQAKNSYERHEIISQSEGRDYSLTLKSRKLIVIMTEKTLKDEIEYDMQNDITVIMENGEQIEMISLSAVKEALQNQGYTIK